MLLTSFRFLCEPTEVRFEAIYLDESNQIKEIREDQKIEINPDISAISLCDLLTLAIGDIDKAYFIGIFIDCNMHAFIPEQDGKMNEHLVARASRFYFGYVMEPSENCRDILVPVASSASFQVSIDVWVEETQDSNSLQWRDNYIAASKNNSILEAALREWEKTSGNQISEWSSRPYKKQVVKYGFNLGAKD